MDLKDALRLVERLENLPELHERIERAVCAVVHSYFQEMLEVEKLEAKIMEATDRDYDALDPLLEQKEEIHKKYWSNPSEFYLPCSASSHPEHLWDGLSNIEVLQNGDDDYPLFVFKADSKDPTHGLITKKAFILRLDDGHLRIEHELFG